MGRPPKHEERKMKNFEPFEIVWYKVNQDVYTPVKILCPDAKDHANAIVYFLISNKTDSVKISKLRKYFDQKRKFFLKDRRHWKIKAIEEIVQSILSQQKKGDHHYSSQRNKQQKTSKPKRKTIKKLKRDPQQEIKSQRRSSRFIEKKEKKLLLQEQLKNNEGNYGYGLHGSQQKVQDDDRVMKEQESEQSERQDEQYVQIRDVMIDDRVQDTTQNFRSLGPKLSGIAKKFYKILKKKGLKQDQSQLVSIKLTQYSDTHNPKETFQRLLTWIKQNSAKQILNNYKNFI